VGIADWPAGGLRSPAGGCTQDEATALAESLLGEADRALYRAKASGRNVAVF
jgi:PleD family two-component response regulator